ncbi:MAG: hypothetical protein ACRDSZ_17165 [Pseudonocardiaceae bacterium]
MPTHIKTDRWVTDTRDDRGPHKIHGAADPITEQARTAADTTTQRTQDSMVQLVRQGLDTSLKSVQVWADLARQVGSTALDSPAGATMAFRAHDPFEMLLAAQREVVGKLVAAQRQLMQQIFDTSAGDVRASR